MTAKAVDLQGRQAGGPEDASNLSTSAFHSLRAFDTRILHIAFDTSC